MPGNIGPLEIFILLVLFGSGALVVSSISRRLNSRPCLRCGERVPNGQLRCDACGFDFETIGSTEK